MMIRDDQQFAAEIRVATTSDIPALDALITASVRGLSRAYYSPAQIDAALTSVFGVDTQLITDGTYYVIDGPSGIAAAGGWSGRRTLYGGDQMKGTDDPKLDPRTEPARIRAFFVHPDFARRGLARQLYGECARAARAAGFRRFELMATLPGEPLYLALGFGAVERMTVTLDHAVDVPFTRMTREIDVGAPVVRPVREDDYDQWRQLWDGYNAFYGRKDATALPLAITQSTWQRFFDPVEPVFALVAEREGILLGLTHFLYHRSTTRIDLTCYLQDLFTAEDARGQGIGRSLIEGVYDRAHAAGTDRVYWQTQSSNTAGRALYDKVAKHFGFIVYTHDW